MMRLNGVDALMLYSETPEVHMHTMKIGVLDVSGLNGDTASICSARSRIRGCRPWLRFVISSSMFR
jgi:hypothetical protein